MLSPTNWEPHAPSYRLNEEIILDWDRNIVSNENRKKIILSDIEQNERMVSSAVLSGLETRLIDKVLDSADFERNAPRQVYLSIPRQADEIYSVLASVDPLLNDQTLYNRMHEQAKLSRFKMSVGSTTATDITYVLGDNTVDSDPSTYNDSNSWMDTYVLSDTGLTAEVNAFSPD